MAFLTRENLESNYYRYADWQTAERGKIYYMEKRVEILEFDGQSAVCTVNGQNDKYTVIVRAISKDRVDCACNCPQAAKVRVCKHMVASMLAMRDYIKNVAESNWQYRLGLAIEQTPKMVGIKKGIEKSLLLLGIQIEKLKNGTYSSYIYPYQVKESRWKAIQTEADLSDPQKAIDYMDEKRTWTQYVDRPSRELQYGNVVNLPPEGVYIYNILLSSINYYGISDFAEFFHYLPLIGKLSIPLFLLKGRNFQDRLHIQSESIPLEAALAFDGTNYTLQAGAQLGDRIFTMVKNNLKILSTGSPAWALAGTTIVPIENAEALNMLKFFPLTIPKTDEQRFRDVFFKPIAERMPIVGDIVNWVDVTEEPAPRLYLDVREGEPLQATLRFGYADYEVEAGAKAKPIVTFDIPGTWGGVRVNRQLDSERSYMGLLTEPKFGLKRVAGGETGMFEIRARVHPFDFLMRCVPALTAAGFEIFGERNLGNINRHKPSIRLNITSGIDWFDIKAIVMYGDQEVQLVEIRKALKKGDQYIKLADGSIGEIPREWIKRYKHLFEMAEETEGGLRVSEIQLSLVDELLADAEQKDIAPEFQQKRERLKDFSNIVKQPIPTNFSGELRPYQHSGLDWLHFLRDYGFGGILADDMGLGKTIQVLAFLQSLREQGKGNTASLLVVPKSLLANWQREAANFTPKLRILEFMGIGRKKDLTAFKDYDIVLTTYGTMLRDIEFLRQFRFHYVILDESQAIKNPLSQGSKAVRLLNADQRLCMTGTPVENNTFELWSQFAFVNPGLLGNMEYFKREFATPIESRQSDETAQLLRRLVYPFILRRTKQQVAPELPPRTERIIYTDLEPTQRKLYNHTRDHYRGMLMGMLEGGDINDARMKILEGLLRLRQICIHPALVEPAYHGDVAKFEIVLETLQTLQAEGHKALVFSQFVQTLHLLETEMHKHKLTYTYLDGQTNNRQERVDLFQNDSSISFFLISLKAGGVGLNLTAADYVIHLDPWWNPAVEIQAADRAHRIGQNKPVFIYKFIARDTVEEKILKLQDRKKELVDQLISAEGSFFKSITTDDVKALFS
jgi:non-specific serine/threonine protein kinase